MNPIHLEHTRTGATASILPAAGFTCYSLKLPVGNELLEVLDSDPDFATTGAHPTRNGIPLLFPYPNRIRGGRFTWAGNEYDLTGVHQDGRGNAIHGLVFDRPWRVVEQRGNRVTAQFQLSNDAPERKSLWPADFMIEVRYELHDAGLRCDIRVANPDHVPLPWGFGTHPYFRVPLSAKTERGDCLIQAPAAEAWELDQCLPTGKLTPVSGARDLREGQALAGLQLDDVLTDLTNDDGRITSIVMDPEAGRQVTQVTDAAFRELVVYTPPHGRSVCLEPYTCATNAIQLVAAGINGGLQVLPPGQEFRTWFEIRAGLIYA